MTQGIGSRTVEALENPAVAIPTAALTAPGAVYLGALAADLYAEGHNVLGSLSAFGATVLGGIALATAAINAPSGRRR